MEYLPSWCQALLPSCPLPPWYLLKGDKAEVTPGLYSLSQLMCVTRDHTHLEPCMCQTNTLPLSSVPASQDSLMKAHYMVSAGLALTAPIIDTPVLTKVSSDEG